MSNRSSLGVPATDGSAEPVGGCLAVEGIPEVPKCPTVPAVGATQGRSSWKLGLDTQIPTLLLESSRFHPSATCRAFAHGVKTIRQIDIRLFVQELGERRDNVGLT